MTSDDGVCYILQCAITLGPSVGSHMMGQSVGISRTPRADVAVELGGVVEHLSHVGHAGGLCWDHIEAVGGADPGGSVY